MFSKWFVVITNLLMVAMCVLMLILVLTFALFVLLASLSRGMQVVFLMLIKLVVLG